MSNEKDSGLQQAIRLTIPWTDPDRWQESFEALALGRKHQALANHFAERGGPVFNVRWSRQVAMVAVAALSKDREKIRELRQLVTELDPALAADFPVVNWQSLAGTPECLHELAIQLADKMQCVLAGLLKLQEQVDKAGEVAPDVEASLSRDTKAVALLLHHPDWTDDQIAKAVGCSRTSLYRWPKYCAARRALKAGRQERPRGAKDADGNLQAWTA